MSTAGIPELRKAQTRARARLARAAARYGKRALARRGSGAGGPPSDQEAARLRELLAAAGAMTAAVREHRAAVNWQPHEQPWSGVAGANPDPAVGTVVGGVPAGWGQGRRGSGCDRRGWPGTAGGGDCGMGTWAEPGAPGEPGG